MKPILFHDIDGVLFGHYGPSKHFQLRPGVNDWMQWAHEHFTIIWFTAWGQEKVKNLVHVLYLDRFGPVKYADWSTYQNKATWLSEKMKTLAGREWYWIDDNILPQNELEALGIPVDRCILVNPNGEHGLEEVKLQLEGRKVLNINDAA